MKHWEHFKVVDFGRITVCVCVYIDLKFTYLKPLTFPLHFSLCIYAYTIILQDIKSVHMGKEVEFTYVVSLVKLRKLRKLKKYFIMFHAFLTFEGVVMW